MDVEGKTLSSEESLYLLARAVWNQDEDNEGECPEGKVPAFRQLDDLISTTAWGEDARSEFFRRWRIVEKAVDKSFEVSSFAELAHLTWQEAVKRVKGLKHPLAPLIGAWQSGPLEVEAVRDTSGNLRSDTIAPRIAMRETGARTDRLYLLPAHTGLDGEGGQIALPGFGANKRVSRIPVLPVELYDLGVQAGVSRGGNGGAPIPARMLVKLAAAPSTSVRHGERFVTYNITLRDLRDALYPPERLDGSSRRQRSVRYIWPHIHNAIRVINQEARIPILDPKSGYGHYHHLVAYQRELWADRSEYACRGGFGYSARGVWRGSITTRLDQWGAESAPAYRALIGLSFLWHEPGRTHAPKGGRWLRKTGLDPYDPLSDDDADSVGVSEQHDRQST